MIIKEENCYNCKHNNLRGTCRKTQQIIENNMGCDEFEPLIRVDESAKSKIIFPIPAPKKVYYSDVNFTKATAYTDGSYKYRKKSKRLGCGAVLYQGHTATLFSETVKSANLVNLKSAGAELTAAAMIVRYCLSHGIDMVNICYDYYNVMNFAVKYSGTNDAITAYHNLMQTAFKKMRICFSKVKSHSTNIYNCRADYLAKQAA